MDVCLALSAQILGTLLAIAALPLLLGFRRLEPEPRSLSQAFSLDPDANSISRVFLGLAMGLSLAFWLLSIILANDRAEAGLLLAACAAVLAFFNITRSRFAAAFSRPPASRSLRVPPLFQAHLALLGFSFGILWPVQRWEDFGTGLAFASVLATGLGQLSLILMRQTSGAAEDEPAPKPLAPLDLQRFEHKVLAGSSRPAPPPGGDVLVESGSFRVDVEKLLDKLREHQLQDPRDFILCWLRCAVASGADQITLDSTEDGLTMTFDGRPFSSMELESPYGALLDPEAPEAKRGRHFAYGLLAVQRLGPAFIEASSGTGEGRAVMILAGRGMSSGDRRPEPGTETILRLRWQSPSQEPDVQGLLSRAKAVFGLTDARLTVNGSKVHPYPWESVSRRYGGNWGVVSEGNWRGAVRHFVPEPDELPTSTVHLYVLGTLIQDVVRHQYFAFEAYLACDDLGLDISQARVADQRKLEESLPTLL
jgi:hypothetical protein